VLVDIFPYYGCWPVHHQVDWALGRFLDCKKVSNIRVFGCSHFGDLQCAVMRDFEAGSKSKKLCKLCQTGYWSYFCGFDQAVALDPMISSMVINLEVSTTNIKMIQQEIITTPWALSLDGEIREALAGLFESLKDICDLTTQTHKRLSKLEISFLGEKERLSFSKAILYEGLRVLTNWSHHKPDAILLFNGRLSPYSVVHFLAKKLDIRVIFHERGEFGGYLFCEGSIPSAGEYVHEYIKGETDIIYNHSISDRDLLTAMKKMYRNIETPANYPDLFNNIERHVFTNSKGFGEAITYIVSSDDEADCKSTSVLAEKQRSFIETICRLGEEKKSRVVNIKVHPNIIGSVRCPGMVESSKYYHELAARFKSSQYVNIYLDRSVNPFSLIDSTQIVVGLHSSLIDYAWFSGKKIITDNHAISRYLATKVIDFFSEKEIEEELFMVHRVQEEDGLKVRSLKCQLEYIALRDLCFNLKLGEVDIGHDYFSPKKSIHRLDLDNDREFEEAASLIAKSIAEKTNVNRLILSHRLKTRNR